MQKSRLVQMAKPVVIGTCRPTPQQWYAETHTDRKDRDRAGGHWAQPSASEWKRKDRRKARRQQQKATAAILREWEIDIHLDGLADPWFEDSQKFPFYDESEFEADWDYPSKEERIVQIVERVEFGDVSSYDAAKQIMQLMENDK